MATISRELAQTEITKWLDNKRVSEKKRENFTSYIDKLEDSMMSGDLILDDKMTLIFTPFEPVRNGDNEITVTEFKFKPRLRIKELHPYLKGVRSDDGDGRLLAYSCALTFNDVNIISELDTDDYAICEAIAVFFT